ncbi:CopD family protein [Streptomyces tropicalis]|uniref:CopD family protein n=1 Tax=Streptomyces tropicalis TaxID=3034234 RepID=A0ABT6AD05_9ACTN|nr:CopD family protein [Streptomyces tropicalis]MDF3302211.1 CopD family protein [Streptomyces tropicalis]
MTLIRPPADADTRRADRRSATVRALAALVLVAFATLVPLFGPAVALHGTGQAAAPGTGATALLRAVLFAAVCIPLGELSVVGIARRLPGAPEDRPASWAPYAAAAGLLAALGTAVLAARGAPPAHAPGAGGPGAVLGSRDGSLAVLEAGAFLVAGVCSVSRRPVPRRPATQLWPAALVIVAEALRAHPPAEHGPLTGSALTLVHVACAALWAGALLHVLRTLRCWRGHRAGAALLGRYARTAGVLVAAVTATGVCSTLRRMPAGTLGHQLTATAYGRTLLAKAVLVAAVALLALCARIRLARSRDPLAACAPARAEIAVLAAVVAVSGLLTALPLPSGRP